MISIINSLASEKWVCTVNCVKTPAAAVWRQVNSISFFKKNTENEIKLRSSWSHYYIKDYLHYKPITLIIPLQWYVS